jgi:hypothetical protein
MEQKPAEDDIVRCRLVPRGDIERAEHHIRDPAGTRREDADFQGWCAHPPEESFAFFLRTYSAVLRRAGGDHALGRKLYGYFLDAGIPTPAVTLVTPLYLADEGKTLPLSTLEATAAAIRAAGLAAEDDLHTALQRLAAFTADPRSLIAGPRIFQLWVRR